SRDRETTLFMTLLAAFHALLARCAGQPDVTIGSAVANRNRSEIEGLIGFFVNMLPLRVDLSGDPAFHQLLGRVREVTLDAFAHQDLPFEKLVEELAAERDLSRTPLFQVVFVFQSAPASPPQLEGLTTSPLAVPHTTAKYDLTLSLEEDRDALAGELEYNRDLFDHAGMRRLAGHFQVLLKGVADDPAARLSELPLLTPAERAELLLEWNETAAPFDPELSVHQAFAARAAADPEAEAVVFRGEVLRYGELNRRADRLAHTLRARGVRADVPVGIFMERS
ncbi:MAG: AMP-binding protein, partial [bacterium]|nr:AMP-binding protein [bacterium]